MPFYKIWSSDRSLRKCILAEDLEELKRKARHKFGIAEDVVLQVVFNSDGTDVEDDDVLKELKGEVLMVLKGGERWEFNAAGGSSIASESLAAGDAMLVHMDEPPKQVDETSDVRDVPLPTFSPLVFQHLQQNRIEPVWNKFISECGNFYFSRYPAMKDSTFYQAIGMKMYKTWPCIGIPDRGSHPWTFFLRVLSQKIRHTRMQLSTKSQLTECELSAATPKKTARMRDFRHQTTIRAPNQLCEADLRSHIRELMDEYQKPRKQQNIAHIKKLLQETIPYRSSLLSKSGGLMRDIFNEFPCFANAIYILFEFSARFGDEKLQKVSCNLKRLIVACHNLTGNQVSAASEEEEAGSLIELFKNLEIETKFDRPGKNPKQHFRTLIDVVDDIDDSQVEKELATKEMESPRIKVFRRDGKVTGMFIIGDKVSTRCQGSSVTSAILQLLCMYYVFDIDYPKCHAMVLGLLQIFVMEEPFNFESSKKFKFFMKKFRPVFEKIAD